MSNNMNKTIQIQILPVEIFHRIFDNLDAQTIVFSIRSVCRSLRAIVNSYNRYKLDLKSIRKSDFHLLCHLISPNNVTLLRISDDEQTPNQIELFISLNNLRKFTRLRSIHFLGITEFQLNIILKRIDLGNLNSVTFQIKEYDDRRKNTTLNYLTAIFRQPTLQKVEFNLRADRISNISLPIHTRLEHLTINSHINFKAMSNILSCSPQLHTLIFKESLSIELLKRIKQTYSFPQVTSLTIENLNATIDELESFLLLMPSLLYLKLIGHRCMLNGKRCEQFIQANLPDLNHFEFFIDDSHSSINNSVIAEDREAIIESFRSSFWVEYKKWFVMVRWKSTSSSYRNTIEIYSLPICKSTFEFEDDSQYIYHSNTIEFSLEDPFVTKNINELISRKELSSCGPMKEGLKTSNYTFFNATKLTLNIPTTVCPYLVQMVISKIDISKLVEFKLESYSFAKHSRNSLFEMLSILEQACSLRSLIIHSRFSKYELYPFLNNLCSELPRQLQSLQIPLNELDQIQLILTRCPQLSVLQFEICRSKFSKEVVDWFNRNTIDSTFRRYAGCEIIWIGKRIDHINENHKRIKLHDSTC